MSDPLPITVYSDVICPWCYVGKRRLEAALASPGMPARIAFTWRPFELNPDMPAEGVERKVYRAGKFGEARSNIGNWPVDRPHRGFLDEKEAASVALDDTGCEMRALARGASPGAEIASTREAPRRQ
jgi:hypothetical protein